MFSKCAYILIEKKSPFSVCYGFIVYRPLIALAFGESKLLYVNINKTIKLHSTVLILNQEEPPKVFYKKVFLKISQNSQENTCARI